MHDVISMKTIAKTLNDWTYTDYFYRLQLIAKSLFKWDNLPNGIDEKWIERFLFSEGECVFFKDPDKGYMVTKFATTGRLNAYDEPTLIKPIATGYSGNLLENGVDCVIIKNNDIALPTSPTLQLFAYRLAEVTRTADVNINAQKTPVFILCDDKQKMSFKQAMKQISENEVAVYSYKQFGIDSIKAIKMDAPVVFDRLEIQKHSYWNEAMTFLGINNANQDKRERQIVGEVEANNEQVSAGCNVFLKARETACDAINKLFNLKEPVKVSLRDMKIPTFNDVERGVKHDN